MSIISELQTRSNNTCELCNSTQDLNTHIVAPKMGNNVHECVLICQTCNEQITDTTKVDPNHWRCLNDSMWSPVPAVQVMAYRMLTQLKAEGWTQNLLDIMYMEEDTTKWAKELEFDAANQVVHKDSNGAVLAAGDTVVLIKDLNVKGANFTAKRGTAVRRITLDHDNAEHIEGKVNGQRIVILTKYVKKSK